VPVGAEAAPSAREGVLAVLLAVVVFLPALRYGFVWDDLVLVQHNQFLQPHSRLTSFVTKDFTELTSGTIGGFFYRPLLALSFWLDGVVWGDRAFGFHLTNLLLHGLAVGLLWLVVQRLGGRLLATLTALLFAVHAAHSEVAVFVSGRVDSLALTPMLAGLWCFLRLRDPADGWIRAWLHVALVGAFLLALGAKESALAFPAVLLASSLAIPARGRPDLPARLRAVLPHMLGVAAVAVTYAVWRHHAMAGNVEQALSGVGLPERLWMAVTAFGYYTCQGLLPIPLGPERFLEIPHSPWHGGVALGAASIAGVASWLRWAWTRRPAAAAGLLWYLVALAPVLALVPVNPGDRFVIAERWLYAPSAGLMLAVAATAAGWLATAPEGRWVRGGLLAWGVTALGASLWITPVWESNETLYRYMAARNPDAPLALMNLAVLEIRAGRPATAMPLLRRGLAVAPDDARLWLNLGWAYREAKRPEQAMEALQESMRLNPAWIAPAVFLGSVYYDTRRDAEGIALMQSVVARAPAFGAGYKYLGAFYERAGHWEEAVKAYRQAIALNPRDRQVFRYLARTEVALGRVEAGVAALEAGLSVFPGDPPLLVELAALYESSGAREKALPIWEAVAAQSGDPELSRLAAARLGR
jgi:tetratricopeptide (TPR) repeat protein